MKLNIKKLAESNHLSHPTGPRHPLLTAAGVGVIAGMRSLSAPTQVACAKNMWGKRAMVVLATLELIADKLPITPDRTKPLLLLGRVGSGALSAAFAPSSRKTPRALLAAVGGLSAVASTYAFFHLRKKLKEKTGVKDFIFAGIEDALTMKLGEAVFKAGKF